MSSKRKGFRLWETSCFVFNISLQFALTASLRSSWRLVFASNFGCDTTWPSSAWKGLLQVIVWCVSMCVWYTQQIYLRVRCQYIYISECHDASVSAWQAMQLLLKANGEQKPPFSWSASSDLLLPLRPSAPDSQANRNPVDNLLINQWTNAWHRKVACLLAISACVTWQSSRFSMLSASERKMSTCKKEHKIGKSRTGCGQSN